MAIINILSSWFRKLFLSASQHTPSEITNQISRGKPDSEIGASGVHNIYLEPAIILKMKEEVRDLPSEERCSIP